MKDFLQRINSPVTIPAFLSLVYFIIKEWVGFEIPGWDGFLALLLGLLAGFGVVNNPTNKTGF